MTETQGVFFRAVIENALTPSVIYISKGVNSIFDITPAQVYKKPHLLLTKIPKIDLKNISDSYIKSISNKLTWQADFRVLTIKRSYKWFNVNVIPTKRLDGSIIWSGTLTDISEIRKAKVKLQKSEERYRQLFAKSPSPTFVCECGTLNFLDVNESALEHTGYKLEEILKINLLKIHIPRCHPTLLKSLTFIPKNSNCQFSLTQITKSKERKIVKLFVSEITFQNKKALLIIINDITELKNTEKILKENNKELRRTNQELDQFVYSVSHDLRAPLTSILGLIHIAELDCNPIRLPIYFNKMKNSVVKLDNSIKGILDYSRNLRMNLGIERIDFHKMIHSIWETLEYIEGINNISLNISIEENVSLYSDDRRIYIILTNLISNAIKYHNLSNPNPYINFQIRITDKYGTIIIEDNGLGILKKHKKKVFNMFYKGSEKPGSGLGLYIVKETTEKLKGVIKLSSEPNEGTTVIVTLPNKIKKKLNE